MQSGSNTFHVRWHPLTYFLPPLKQNKQVKAAYDKPIDVLKKIGATLPKPAAFFINFIIIKVRAGWMDGWMEKCIRRLGHPHIAGNSHPSTNHTTHRR